jgi:predicted nuclease of predicted toxin-antitoxin system
MPKPFYKHKTLLDEHLYHRRVYPLLNEHFDVKHIRDDLHLDGLPDPAIYELARQQGRIILTKNVKDFRPLLRDDSPGIIGIPETWSTSRIDTKLTALLTRHGPNYFRGRIRSLSAEDVKQHGCNSHTEQIL